MATDLTALQRAVSKSQTRADLAYALASRGGTTATAASASAAVAAALAAAAIPKSVLTAIGDMLYASAPGVPARLPVHNEGDVMTISGGLPAWAPTGLSGWTTLYEVDFTSLPTQNLISGGDGAKTIDGKTWMAANTAGATTFGITNGVGLVIERNGLDPTLYAVLTGLASTLSPFHDDLEVWVRLTNANVSVDFEWAQFGLFKSPDGNKWSLSTGHRHGSDKATVDHWLSLAHYNTGDVGFATTPMTTTNLTDDVIVCRLLDEARGAFFSGVYSAGWPAFATLANRGLLQTYTPPVADPTQDPTPGDACVFFTASGGNTKVTITNLRIRARQ